MFRFVLVLFLPALLTVMVNTAKSQSAKIIEIDLALQDEDSKIVQPLSLDLQEENVSFLIKNRLVPATNQYNVDVQLENIAVPPLPNSLLASSGDTTKSITAGKVKMQRTDSACILACVSILEEISEATSEKQLPSLKNKLSDELNGNCKGTPDVIATYVKKADSLTSYKPVNNIRIKKGQQITIVISRSAGGKGLKWTNVYTTGARGHWAFSYGFSFPYLANEERDYFTKKDSDTSFVITEKNSIGKVKFIPAVYIHWFPASDELNDWSYSLAGGIGFDLKNPVVFLGASATFNQNLSFMLGGMLHQVNDLNGRYNPNDKVKENLGSEQLLEQKWVLNPCFTIAFRFENSPFK